MNAPIQKSIQIAEAATPADHPEFDGHENIVFAHDEESGLRAIIAVHNTKRGPALGGCRMWSYSNTGEALTDALRLSKGMSYKNALAGLDLGGGKSVIIANPREHKTPQLLRAFGRHVHRLGGTYITAEDVGITAADMEIIGSQTPFAKGTEATGLGDPSPYTALGVFEGIKAAVAFKNGTDDLKGARVSVQGLGNVGYTVARHLHIAGAELIVSDINETTVQRACDEFGAQSIAPNTAHAADCDVFAPCALGAGLNTLTIPQIKAPIVAGAANNQLQTTEDGVVLFERGILYAPDYAINAGGVISIALAGAGDSDDHVRQKTENIFNTLTEIFKRSAAEGRPTSVVADELAEEILQR
ncbi:Glu/Leu/Phe/Val dehydrogenase [Rhodobacteraceae bacterium RKSG542]|uniref:Glu/Leu/Phe/Val family dehydrogenase n=1 Tax=Pseudovibrio flavus TaxID=2529854 RepID=UPI0012BD53B3|nr:Glu/Leu/Phe/Val dehydrogenase [Pseudovibrio flavus]MTI16898.1 Glu/Leu/Phe/Val dehydrogenase [Pseudovibrio flavus]